MRSDPCQQLRPNSDGLKPISPSTRRPPAANRPPISSVRESSPSVDDQAPARRQSSPSMSSGQHRSAPSSSSIFPMARPRATVQLTPTLHSTHLTTPSFIEHQQHHLQAMTQASPSSAVVRVQGSRSRPHPSRISLRDGRARQQNHLNR
ncbi:hypothetical protein ACLOJK_026970 [Asimina triloba]